MSIATIKLDEPSKLEFGVSITGADGKPETRFIIEGKNFSVSYPCTQVNGGVEVEIQGLKEVFTAGEYNARLEIILDNKIYTPLIDKIEFEPSVAIATKTKSVVKESISITVKKPVINEDHLRKVQAATIIAQSLGYHPPVGAKPQDIINQALESVKELTVAQLKTVKEMLDLAEEVGIKYNEDLIPPVIEEKTEEPEAADEQDPEDEGWDDESLDKMAGEVDDWDDVVDVYDKGELHLVDADTGEHVDDLDDELSEDTLNEVLSRIERIRAKMRFHKSEAKRERKLHVALHRHSNSATINNRARRLAIKLVKTKLARKPISDLSVAEKERIEKIVSRRKQVINRLALKLTSRVRMIEKNRLSGSKK